MEVSFITLIFYPMQNHMGTITDLKQTNNVQTTCHMSVFKCNSCIICYLNKRGHFIGTKIILGVLCLYVKT